MTHTMLCMSTYYHTAAAIAIHNFPEGIATFIIGLATPQLGIALAIAIAVHNIPEGTVSCILQGLVQVIDCWFFRRGKSDMFQ